ncbi:Pkinase-domain-containing protein [Thelephora terrestris]|uniref:mitogen-activated protein kinase kinase kinase n=1 Tax=Thelephora terrestris TaxID=56493 RepID=A0A9P6H6D8_9AGAM|nr:Pkinase-domain-containing protein [Thelephora terrestris]
MTLNGFHDPQANSPTSPTGTSNHNVLYPNAPRQSSSRSPHSSLPSTPTINKLSDILEPPPGVTFLELVRTWTDSDVARWLSENKVGHLANAFKTNDIRSDVILDLNQESLKEMGIKSVGERIRVLNAVKALRQRNSLYLMSKSPLSPATDDLHRSRENSPTQRAATNGRRLDSARPAPLQLVSDSGREGLPRLVRDGSESARTDTSRQEPGRQSGAPVRPLPFPNRQNGTQPTNTPTSTPSVRHNLPPLPPPPRGQPPLPPTTPSSSLQRSGSSSGNHPRKTPNDPNFSSGHLQTGLLTPTNGQWGLPSDPRPSGGRTPSKGGSPFSGGVAARSPAPPNNHGRNSSLSHLNPNLVPVVKVPPRPSTSGSGSRSTSYPDRGQHVGDQNPNLSPIREYSPHDNSGFLTPSPPTGFRVGSGPYQRPTTPSTATSDKRLVKFQLPEAGQSVVIDTGDCAGGVEILEKAIKKLKVTQRIPESNSNENMMDVGTNDGGLSVEGWGVFADWTDTGHGKPLTEAHLLTICHSPTTDLVGDHRLTLRRIGTRGKRSKALAQIFGATPPIPATPGLSYPEDEDLPPSPKFDRTFSTDQADLENIRRRQSKRASTISVLSGLGVDLDKLDAAQARKSQSSPSDSHGQHLSPSKPQSKLRNFFGQRPPSELITQHLTAYFPAAERKVLQRTRRQSMMKSGAGNRDSIISWNPPGPSRFSISTQGSGNARISMMSTRASVYGGIPPMTPSGDLVSFPKDRAGSSRASVISGLSDTDETAEESDGPSPKVSISLEDGREFDLDSAEGSDTLVSARSLRSSDVGLLPPVKFPSESLSESIGDGFDVGEVDRAMTFSTASNRMSMIMELRGKKDLSDAVSLLTVDEITAEVENKQHGSDEEDEEEYEEDEDEDEDEEEEEDGDEVELELHDADEPGKPITSHAEKTIKWIKGALIGAGSFGQVYLGMDAATGLLMAVKQVSLPTGSGVNQERKKAMLSALEREIELLRELQHENIVQYHASCMDQEHLNIFLEYVPGGSVTALLRNYGAFEETLVKNFVRQILNGLAYLHEKDIIHRDIKGANILVDNKGGIKISDFGISKKVEDNLLTGSRAHRPSLQGSVFWMAPEVVKQTTYTRKADIWSVGCLVVEMLTGEHPWAQLSQMQAIFKIGSSAKPTIPSDISTEADNFLQLTFELNHEARPDAVDLVQHVWITG